MTQNPPKELKEKILKLKDLRKKYHMDDWVKTSEYLTLIELESELKGFLAGQKAEQERISGIIGDAIKHEKELRNKSLDEDNLYSTLHDFGRLKLQELLAQITNNSPRDTNSEQEHSDSRRNGSILHRVELQNSADRMPSTTTRSEGSPTPSQICECGHDKRKHTIIVKAEEGKLGLSEFSPKRYKGMCSYPNCSCQHFTPQPQTSPQTPEIKQDFGTQLSEPMEEKK